MSTNVASTVPITTTIPSATTAQSVAWASMVFTAVDYLMPGRQFHECDFLVTREEAGYAAASLAQGAALIAISLPEMRWLLAAISAFGAVVIVAAAIRSDDRFERLFASGFAASMLWGIYFTATRFPSGRSHTFVYLGSTAAAFAVLIVALILAGALRQRLAALALVLTIGGELWESIVSVACRDFFRFSCRGATGLAAMHIPNGVHLVLIVAAITLMVVAAVTPADAPPSPLIYAAIAATFLWDLVLTIIAVASRAPPIRLMGVTALIGWGASLALAWRAVQERTRRATMFGAGLAIAAIPAMWNGLRNLTST